MRVDITKFRRDFLKHFYRLIDTDTLILSFVDNVIKPFCDKNQIGYETNLRQEWYFVDNRGEEVNGIEIPKEVKDAIREIHSITNMSFYPQESYYPWISEG